MQAFLISQTLAFGWQRTALASFSPLLSDAPIIALAIFVLSHVPQIFIQALQIVGGIYLLYLAMGAIKTYKTYDALEVLQPPSGQKTLFKAVVVNLLNPNPYLAWSLVMGPLLLKAWHESPVDGIILLVGFYTTLVLGLFGTIMLIAAFRSVGAKINRILIGVSGIALGGFGLYALWLGIQGLL